MQLQDRLALLETLLGTIFSCSTELELTIMEVSLSALHCYIGCVSPAITFTAVWSMWGTISGMRSSFCTGL